MMRYWVIESLSSVDFGLKNANSLFISGNLGINL